MGTQETTHTPGPWETVAGPGVADLAVCAAGAGDIVAEVVSLSRANQSLIAAAPDLLAALRVLADHAQETYPHFESSRGQTDIAAARAAIAKAEGGAK